METLLFARHDSARVHCMSTAGRQSCILSNSASAAFCATAHFAGPPILGMCIRKHNGTRVMVSKQLASTEVLVLFHQFVGLFCRRRFTTPGIPAYAVKQNVSCPTATALLWLLFRLTQLLTTLCGRQSMRFCLTPIFRPITGCD